MSGTVRILAIAFGAALAALLYLGWHVPWYIAGPAGLIVLVVFPICHELIARLRRDVRLNDIRKVAQDRRSAQDRKDAS